MKKLLAFSAMLLLCALLTVGIFAAEKTVYLAAAGDDANGGTSYTDAVKTIERAYALLGSDNGKIVVCSYYNVGANVTLPAHSGTVTFTASDGKNYFPLGKIAFSGALTLSGDTVFDRIGLSASGTSFLCAGGKDMTLGAKVVTTGDIVLLGGYNVTGEHTIENASIAEDYTVTVLGGKYAYFRGGNRRATGTSPFGMISGNVTFNIAGGSFSTRDSSQNLSAAAGMNEHSGNITVNISGGVFAGSLFAIGRAGTNNTAQQPTVSGNISICVTGGTLNGKRLEEMQDDTVHFTGKYTLDLAGGSYPQIESIKGSATASIHVADKLKNAGGTVNSFFQNPLRGGADPWVIYKDGYYYMTTVSGVTVYCYKSATLDGLAYVEGHAIWTAPKDGAINDSNRMYSAEIWSPELHYVEADEFGAEYAGWWLYFAADDGENTNHRLYTVRALTEDATGAYGSPVTREVNVPVKMVVDNDTTWAIGQSLLRVNGTTYLTWTSETGRGTADHAQNLSISKMSNPYTPVGETGIICVPDYKWETRGYAYNASKGASYPKVVEGATAVYGDDGEIMIIYSASGYWTNYYCLSTLVLKDGADPMLKDSWIKAEEPVFQRQNGVFGPGHAAYTTDAAGNRWMIYHAYLDWKRTNRYVFIQPWRLEGTTVDMNGGPYSQDTTFTIVNRQTSVVNAISGFAN